MMNFPICEIITRSYFPKEVELASVQLHRFCDASEVAYSEIVYLRAKVSFHTALIMAKTKVAPIK